MFVCCIVCCIVVFCFRQQKDTATTTTTRRRGSRKAKKRKICSGFGSRFWAESQKGELMCVYFKSRTGLGLLLLDRETPEHVAHFIPTGVWQNICCCYTLSLRKGTEYTTQKFVTQDQVGSNRIGSNSSNHRVNWLDDGGELCGPDRGVAHTPLNLIVWRG